MQFFCGLPGYEDKPSFDASLMVHFRKRLTAAFIHKTNEDVISSAEKTPSTEDKDNNPKELPQIRGTMLLDATCTPSFIKYPQDTELLNEARENLEKIIDMLHTPTEGKTPRTYPKQARKAYLAIARKKKKPQRDS